jgi:glycosyltransferase involved in cell wall biosynthesis
MRAAIVIPAFNEARTIRDIARRSLQQCDKVFVVDDGSTDGTGEALTGLPVVLLRHEVNRGKAAALWTGFASALAEGADVVVTLDGDGQHRPEDVPLLMDAARIYPHRLIIAARLRGRDKYPRTRYFANRLADFWVSWAAGHSVADSQSGQRLYPAALLEGTSLRHDEKAAFTLESEIIIEAARRGYSCVGVPILAIYDRAGRRSHFRPVRDIARIARMLAFRLLGTGMNPAGLWRCLRQPPCIVDLAHQAAVADPVADTA